MSYPVILHAVKTAISVPDKTFAEATARAAALGISRSEFFTRAARRYLEHLDDDALTEQVNAAVAVIGADESASAAVSAGRRRVAVDSDESW